MTFVTVLSFIYFITSERDFFDVRAKNVSVQSGVVKPSLTVQITVRKPIALLKYHLNDKVRFFQVDPEGYVLENFDSLQASDTYVTIVADAQGQLPERDSHVHSECVQLALSVLRSVQSRTPEIASKLRTIDANQPDKIILQLDDLPVVWLSSDLIETGLYNIDLFLKNLATIVKQKKRNRMKGYLDARFEDAIYWGGKHG